ncbi:transposable element Tcb1 transposase [Trichonephila clavipes]|nr:transposable element Tcb1 transposase [Trichonephila clavipes]
MPRFGRNRLGVVDIPRTPRSPDLWNHNYFLWEHLENLVYVTPPDSTELLFARISEAATCVEVSEELGITLSVISRLWQRFQDDRNISKCYNADRPRVTTPNEGQCLTVTTKRRSRASDLSRQLFAATELLEFSPGLNLRRHAWSTSFSPSNTSYMCIRTSESIACCGKLWFLDLDDYVVERRNTLQRTPE